MTPPERECLLLVGETIAAALARLDDNAADALEVLNQTVVAWGEARVRMREVRRNIGEVYDALRRTPRRAAPGAFARIHERLISG